MYDLLKGEEEMRPQWGKKAADKGDNAGTGAQGERYTTLSRNSRSTYLASRFSAAAVCFPSMSARNPAISMGRVGVRVEDGPASGQKMPRAGSQIA